MGNKGIDLGDYIWVTQQQFVNSTIAERAEEDPAIVTIFESTQANQLIEQLLVLAMSRKAELEALKAELVTLIEEHRM